MTSLSLRPASLAKGVTRKKMPKSTMPCMRTSRSGTGASSRAILAPSAATTRMFFSLMICLALGGMLAHTSSGVVLGVCTKMVPFSWMPAKGLLVTNAFMSFMGTNSTWFNSQWVRMGSSATVR